MIKWSDGWILRFNHDKCTVMHVGHSYDTQYHIVENGISRKLSVTTKETDLGVYVTHNLKSSTQCLKAANEAMACIAKNGQEEFP